MIGIHTLFCINLIARKERLSEFYSRLPAGQSVTIIPGVDGRLEGSFKVMDQLTELEAKLASNRPLETKRQRAEFGCFLSHLRIWTQISRSEVPNDTYFAIFEDDCFFAPDFLTRWQSAYPRLPPSIDLIYLGGRATAFFIPSHIHYWPAAGSLFRLCARKLHKLGLPSYETDRTTHAYIVSKQGAERLINYVQKSLCDHQVDKFMTGLSDDLQSYDLFPHLCWSPFDYKSDIQDSPLS